MKVLLQNYSQKLKALLQNYSQKLKALLQNYSQKMKALLQNYSRFILSGTPVFTAHFRYNFRCRHCRIIFLKLSLINISLGKIDKLPLRVFFFFRCRYSGM